MRTYSFYIEDDRYSVPTLLFVTTSDEAGARRVAREELADPHHLSVEVREDDELVFKLAQSGANRHIASPSFQAEVSRRSTPGPLHTMPRQG